MTNSDSRPLLAAACLFVLGACGGGGGGDDPLVIIDPIPILVEFGQEPPEDQSRLTWCSTIGAPFRGWVIRYVSTRRLLNKFHPAV